MAESIIDEFQEDFALLVEAGFVACKQLDEMCAMRLFQAAELLDPDNPAPRVGFGYIALNKLELDKASKIFEEILAKDPEHQLAQTFLGICRLLDKSKRKEGKEMIKKAIEATDDPTIENLGKVALLWNEKDLTTKKAPFFSSE